MRAKGTRSPAFSAPGTDGVGQVVIFVRSLFDRVVPGTRYLIAFDSPLWPGPFSPQPSANRLLQVTNELVAAEWSAGSLV